MAPKLKVLIVEDSEDDAALLVYELKSAGFNPQWKCVESESDYRAGLREPLDIIFSDFKLPRFSGQRALEILRASELEIPFIIVSGTIGEELAVESMKAGATDYVLKEHLARLGPVVRRALGEFRERRERKRAEQQLRVQAKALETAANSIVITDQEGSILWVNPAFCALSGYGLEEALGKNPRLLKSGKHGPAFYQHLWKEILSGKTWRGEFVNRRKDGSLFHGEQTITPVHDEAGRITHFIGIMSDITSRKQAEEEARKSRERLRALAARLQAAREEERIRISREIHDRLGETLTGLKFSFGWMRTTLENGDTQEVRKQLLERIAAMGALADDTAHHVRKLCTELRPSVLDDLGIVPAIEWQVSEFQARTNIRAEAKAEVRHLVASRDQATALFRICQEILTNVARHAQASKVRVALKAVGGNLLLQVKDNGKGFKAEDMADTKTLGLLGMQERAAILGGKVEILGEPGSGTTVTVTIPMARSQKRES